MAWRLGAILSALALLATGCGGTGEPADAKDALIAALEATLKDSFAFEVSGELSPAFRDVIIRDDPSAGAGLAMVTSATLTGRSDGEDGTVALEALGTRLGELRSIGDADLYLQVDTQTIAGISQGGFDPDHAVTSIAELALPPDITAFLEAGVRGGWIGVLGIGDLDLADIGAEGLGFPVESFGGDLDQIDEAIERTRERFSDPAVVIGEFTTVTVTESDGAEVYEVAIEVHALIREAAEIVGDLAGDPVPEEDVQQTVDQAPERIEGLVITTRESRITGVSFDVGRAATAFPDAPPELQPGAVVIEVALADHGAAEPVDAPDDAVTITAEQLVEVFLSLFGGMLGPELGDDPSGAPPGQAAVASDARNLAIAMETYYTDLQTYTDDLDALVGQGAVVAPGHAVAICLYEDGQAYVLYVTDGLGNDMYYDSGQGGIIEGTAPTDLGCEPTL
ncbi:MAG: hypothetical protein KY469_00865 [Actinobacteria bacterium]|nr:hypothetical protein [Actinomycetota bacterium]